MGVQDRKYMQRGNKPRGGFVAPRSYRTKAYEPDTVYVEQIVIVGDSEPTVADSLVAGFIWLLILGAAAAIPLYAVFTS